jgi:aryl-phospho-beta-D-glucosidase BglC (GH1 family)
LRFRLLSMALGLAALSLATGQNSVASNAGCAIIENFPNSKLLAAMRRGVNLPGWDSAEPGSRPTITQLEALRQKGFTHIRLPLDASRLSGQEREAYLGQMFEQVILLFSLDYAVSLDLHAGSLMKRDAAAEAQLVELWRAIAARVRPLDPEKLAVELLNEPQTDSANWWPVAGRLAAEVRRILPEHTIIVGPAGPQRLGAYRPRAAFRRQRRLRHPLLRPVRLHASGR